MRRGVNSAVGFGCKERFFSVIIFMELLSCLFSLRSISYIAVSHVRNFSVRFKINSAVHPGRDKNIIMHILLKWFSAYLLYKKVKQLEGWVNILILSARRKMQTIQVLHVFNGLHIGCLKHKLSIITRTRIRNSGRVRH